jgi:hypothetical protein
MFGFKNFKATGRFIKGSIMSAVIIEKSISELQQLVEHLSRCLGADLDPSGPSACAVDFYAQLASETSISVHELKRKLNEGITDFISQANEILLKIQDSSEADKDSRFRFLISFSSLSLSFYCGYEDLMPPETREECISSICLIREFLNSVDAFNSYKEDIRGMDTPLLSV